MKKPLLFNNESKKWNFLLKKLNKHFNQFNLLIKKQKLTNKLLNSIAFKIREVYLKLLTMNPKLKIKTIGGAFAIMFSTITNAQSFTERTGVDNPLTFITSTYQDSPYLSFADLDGDNDSDLMLSSSLQDYYLNTGTNNSLNFTVTSSPINLAGTDYATEFVDIDNDGDFDAFIGSKNGTISYYENTGTTNSPVFVQQGGSSNPIGGIFLGNNCKPRFVDIDNDGDMDLFIGSIPGNIKFYENTGSVNSPIFTEQTGASNPLDNLTGLSDTSPAFVDIDNDGDQDLFCGDYDGTIYFYRNTGSANSPIFTLETGIQNPFNGIDLGSYSSPVFTDIDGDGDMDAFISEQTGTVKYFENTTAILVSLISLTGQNGSSNITTSGGNLAINASVLPINADDITYNWSVVNGSGSASINSNGLLTAITDGIVTVIATANDASGTTGYIEISISNQSVSIDEENSEFVFNIFPNPTNSTININTNQHKVTEINIIDINGRFIKSLNPSNKSFDVSDLISGIYTIQIHTKDKIVYRKFIKE